MYAISFGKSKFEVVSFLLVFIEPIEPLQNLIECNVLMAIGYNNRWFDVYLCLAVRVRTIKDNKITKFGAEIRK